MKLKTWLDAGRGRAASLAIHLDLSAGRISQIAADGVPVKFMQAVSLFTQGDVSIEDMVGERTPAAKPTTEPAAAGV